ncbi:hypothetical protein HanPSC8_Chr10g0416461 [Helianthus annuus]|nr:hypothetical protein HanPSC8_Chr10g0416461 [Helianthus annuus]
MCRRRNREILKGEIMAQIPNLQNGPVNFTYQVSFFLTIEQFIFFIL